MFGLKWKDLIGQQEYFSLERRVFHAVCLITSLIILISLPSNFLINLDVFACVLLVLLVFLLVLYYYSRYQRQSRLSVGIYIGFMYFVLFFGYLYNCGIDGPMTLIFGMTFLIQAVIVKERHLLFYLGIHLSIGILLLYLEYEFPEIIAVKYERRSYRFIDIALTLGFLLLSIYLTIRYLKKNYKEKQQLSNKKNEELLKANATKDKLFSIISHDLRTPFNALIGLSQMLKENGDELDAAEKVEFVDAIYETSKKTYSLLENLLEWSLAQTNQIQFLPENINLSELVNHSLLTSLEAARSKGIEIKMNISEDLTIIVDRNMMETVFRNLVSNAIKFTDSKGLIVISAHEDYRGITILITDNGIGMSKATLQSLFEQKVTDSSDAVKGRGMGLGLILCKDFVQRQGGEIWAESENGKGSKFFVLIKK
ncbi:sensor histidine kinase [Flavobacterium sp. 7A]|uniref:sensor histidine kinase n=1 Tax=Flavobacterium sp. 7A TaxID=2940571 RepID=UPI0022277D74|nr:HAMP domain-containing sensor histidine kinase [Flavobacterium sp. 7A]MCW2119809.1 signal transduction histidine kinase [Flavobacterium sp. 7A]